MANVVPFFKKGKKDKPGKSRLLSLTPLVGKGILGDRTHQHLDSHGLSRNSQHSFMHGHLCLISFMKGPRQLMMSGLCILSIWTVSRNVWKATVHGTQGEPVH